MDCFFHINDSALLISLVWLHCFFNKIYTFNNNTISFEVDCLNLALFAFVFPGKDLNGIVHFQLLHFSSNTLIKALRERVNRSSKSSCFLTLSRQARKYVCLLVHYLLQ